MWIIQVQVSSTLAKYKRIKIIYVFTCSIQTTIWRGNMNEQKKIQVFFLDIIQITA